VLLSVTAAAVVALAPFGSRLMAQQAPRFASEIEAFAQADRQAPPQACGYLFVGSSSVRMWGTLQADMAPLPVLNRGFGGSTMAEVNHYFHRIVAPYRPRAIVLYAGENDIDAGEPPARVAAEVRRFMELKTRRLGDTPVYFIALKPSKLRLGQLPRQAAVNASVRAMAARRDDLHFIDVAPAMMDAGAPKNIFLADGLHMDAAGYEIWTRSVRPVLEADATRPARCEASVG
jgi:lysophospholipase L1-like esterase